MTANVKYSLIDNATGRQCAILRHDGQVERVLGSIPRDLGVFLLFGDRVRLGKRYSVRAVKGGRID